MMEKSTFANSSDGDDLAPMSGGGSSMDDQWEIVVDQDEFRSILKATLPNSGFEVASKMDSFERNGGISLEENVNSLEIGRLSIQDDELEEMRKQQQHQEADANCSMALEGPIDGNQPREKVDAAQDSNITGASPASCDHGMRPSDDDVLNDITSVIASDGQLVSDLEDCDVLSVANIRSVNSCDTELDRDFVMIRHVSPRSDRFTPMLSSPSTASNFSSSVKGNSPLEDGERKLATGILDPDHANVAQGVKVVGKDVLEEKSCKVDIKRNGLVKCGDVIPQVRDDVCSPSSLSERGKGYSFSGNRDGKRDTTGDKSPASESNLTCQMCPVEYKTDDEEADLTVFDENCDSGELIPHGRGSTRGRPKTIRPPKSVVQREIRPKPSPSAVVSVSLPDGTPPGSRNLLPNICQGVAEAQYNDASCLPPTAVPSVVDDVLRQPMLDDDRSITGPERNRKGLSMDCLEGDGPVSFVSPPTHRVGQVQGQNLPVNVLPQVSSFLVTPQASSSHPQHFVKRVVPPSQPVQQQQQQQQQQQYVGIPQPLREAYYPEEQKFLDHSLSSSSSAVGHHGGATLHHHFDKNDVSVYRLGPAPVTSGSGIGYICGGKNDYVLATRKDAEKAGIPFIATSHPQASAGVQTAAKPNDSQRDYPAEIPLHVNRHAHAEQQHSLRRSVDGRIYHSIAVAARNQPPVAREKDPPSYDQHLSQSQIVGQYQGLPVIAKSGAYFTTPHASPNVDLYSVSPSISTAASQLSHPVPAAQPKYVELIPSNMNLPDQLPSPQLQQPVPMTEVTMRTPSSSARRLHGSGSSTSISSMLDGRDIPKEDAHRRTEAWILSSSGGASHHVHPYKPHQYNITSNKDPSKIPSSVARSNNIYGCVPAHDAISKETAETLKIKHVANATKGQGSSKDISRYKGRPPAKEKKIDTAVSHQEYLRQLPRKPDDCNDKQTFHQLHQCRAVPAHDAINVRTVDVIPGLPRQFQNETVERFERANEICAEADTEIEKMLETFNQAVENFPLHIDESAFDSLYPEVKDQQLQRDTTSRSEVQFKEKSLSHACHIDQSQYLNSRDKESLEEKIRQGNSSLDKYLRSGNKTTEPITVSQVEMRSSSSQRDFWQCHQGESSLQPPTETAKICVMAWAQQSDNALRDTTPSLSDPGHALHHPFDATANLSAKDFPQLLHSFTGSEDENMKSASLSMHCGISKGNDRNLEFPQDCVSAKNHHFPNRETFDYDLRSGGASSVLRANIPKAAPLPRAVDGCFQKPFQPGSKNHMQTSSPRHTSNDATNLVRPQATSLSASVSHSHSLILSSIASGQSQPMSSLKGESDVSMQSDLSHQVRQDRSMNSDMSIEEKERLQGQTSYDLPQSHLVHHSVTTSDSKSKRKTNNIIMDWFEKSAPFLEAQGRIGQNAHPVLSKTHDTPSTTIPQDVRQITQHNAIPVEAQRQILLQDQQQYMLQKIPPPSSPSRNKFLGEPFHNHPTGGRVFQQMAGDHEEEEEEGYESFVVPDFSINDLLPRCGGSRKTPSAANVSCRSSSSASQGRATAKSSQKSGSQDELKERSSTTTPTCTNDPPKSQKKSGKKDSKKPSSSTTTTTSTTITPSSCDISKSSTSNTTLMKSSPVQMSNSKFSAPATSHKVVKVSLSNGHVSTEAKKTPPRPTTVPDERDDVVIVGEKMRSSVNISHGPPPTGQRQKVDVLSVKERQAVEEKDEDDEDEDEEEVSFSGSDVFRPDEQGETDMGLKCIHDKRFGLRKAINDPSILHCLCDIDLDHLEQLASAPGFTEALNFSNKAQETPLFVGVHNRRTDVTKFLIKQGADTSVSCFSPANAYRGERVLQSVLHEAAELGDVKTLIALLESDTANIDIGRPGSGQTPLMVALKVHSFSQRNSSADRSKVVISLLKQGASMNIQDLIEGKTPFMYAIQSKDVEIVKRFLNVMDADEARQAVTTRTSRGATCLHFAASLKKIDRAQKVEVIRLLILAGADASVRNAEGESPRDWANDEITEVFKKLAPPK